MNKYVKLRLVLISPIPPIHQSFLWQTVSACWAQRLYVRPSLREQKIIVSLCVNSVWPSIRAQILLLPWANAREEVSLLRRSPLENYTWFYHLYFACVFLVDCKSRKHQTQERPDHCACVAPGSITILRILTLRARELASWVVLEDSNLVDPASSHMLVSKTKPCMSKYKCYTAKLRMAH